MESQASTVSKVNIRIFLAPFFFVEVLILTEYFWVDLVENTSATSTTEELPRQIMATSIGFKYRFCGTGPYRFVINSKSGRFISPVSGVFAPTEVIFMKGFSGNFKLLGHQDMNGCLAALVRGKPGPYKIF